LARGDRRERSERVTIGRSCSRLRALPHGIFHRCATDRR
jgi:hypothetical protein